ncbi:ROK family protein [Glaciihabitans sp. UYNi722]|uniref:ROK family protein n=1 Tax=Glaciihabitans sp. UYNi722 TaxID=3156344 RepID=UPI0033956573
MRSADWETVLGLDVGGTAVKGVVVGADLSVGATYRWETGRENGPDAVVERILLAAEELVASNPSAVAIGLVVPGFVDDEGGVGLFAENIGWRDVPFRALLAERTDLPVGFGHDVRAGGLAEHRLGAAKGFDDALFLALGTGVAGAIFVDGRQVIRMNAGEIGHIDVGSGAPCVCGAVGCLETVSSGPAVLRRFVESGGVGASSAAEVVALAATGDSAASSAWEGAIDGLARALATYISLLDPQVVVIGGGLSHAGPALFEPLRERLTERLTWQNVPTLSPAALGDLAAAIGASLLARGAWGLRR